MAVNYLEIIGKYFPDAEAHATDDPSVYGNLIWSGSAIAVGDLDIAYLTEVKTDKLLEFSEEARMDIVHGFSSSALGYLHKYDSEPEDQLNMIGAVAADVDIEYSCRPYTNATQDVNVGGAITGSSVTGLPNTASSFTASISIDGAPVAVDVTGNLAQDYTSLVNEINTDLGIAGTALIAGGNLCIKSASYGASSIVAITDTNLFNSLTDYVGINAAVDGINGSDTLKEYKLHTVAQMKLVLQDGKDVKLSVLQKFNTKKDTILVATSVSAVNAITWD